VPGTGQYDAHTALDKVQPRKMANNASFGRAKRQIRLTDAEDTPAVTDYAPNYEKKAQAKRSAAFKFSTSEREGIFANQMTPIGPGHYDTDTSAAARILSAKSSASNLSHRPKSLTLNSSSAVNTLKKLSAQQNRAGRHSTNASAYSIQSTTSSMTTKSLIHNASGAASIPSYSHDPNARYKASPAFSFGKKKRESAIDGKSGPSPHDYNTEMAYDVCSMSRSTSGAATFFKSKRKTMDFGQNMDSPGVGNYNVESALDKTKPSLPRAAIQKSKRVIKLQHTEDTPGVTDYSPNHNIRSRNLGSVAPIRAPRFQETRVQNSPNVHTYASDPLKFKQSTPQATMHLYGK